MMWLEMPGSSSNQESGKKKIPPNTYIEISLFSGKFDESVNLLKDYIAVMGLTQRQFAALLGAGYSLGDTADCSGLFCNRNSFSSNFSTLSSVPVPKLSNVFFINVLSYNWEEIKISDNITMYQVRTNSSSSCK